MSKKHAAGFTSNYENNGRVQTLADKKGLNKAQEKPWVIRLISRENDKVNGKPIKIARYELSFKQRPHMTAEAFYEQVYKTLHEEEAEAIKLLVPSKGRVRTHTIHYPKGYIEAMYRRYVLGENFKASPEVEELVSETEPVETE